MTEQEQIYNSRTEMHKRIDIRDLLDNPKSKCCGAKVTIAGTVTHFYVCKECKKACDVS